MLSATELKEQIQVMGADLVGVAKADSPLLKEYGEKTETLLSEAQSLISIGVALNRTAVCSGNLLLNRYDTMCVYERINHICLETIRLLSREGAKAVSVPPYLPVNMGAESKGMKGEINHKTVAAVAGLGGIGLSRLLVTPDFGPFVRLGTVVTEISLIADQPLEENLVISVIHAEWPALQKPFRKGALLIIVLVLPMRCVVVCQGLSPLQENS